MSGKGLLAGILGGGAQGYADVSKMEIGRQIEDERAAAADRRQRALMELQNQYARDNAETQFGYQMAAQEAGNNYQSQRDQQAAEAATRAKAADREFEWDKMSVEKAYGANEAAQKHRYQMEEDVNKERAKAKYDKADKLKMANYMQDVLKDGRSALQLAFGVKIGTDEFGNIDVQGDEKSRGQLFSALELYDRSARNDPTFDKTASTELLNNAIAMAQRGYAAPSRWQMNDDGSVVVGQRPDGSPIVADGNNPVVSTYLSSIGLTPKRKEQGAPSQEAPAAKQAAQPKAATPQKQTPPPPPSKASADDQFVDRLRAYAAKSKANEQQASQPLTSAKQAPIVGAEANRLAAAYSRVNDLIEKINYGRANYGLLDNISDQDVQDAIRFAQVTGRTSEIARINQLMQAKGAK